MFARRGARFGLLAAFGAGAGQTFFIGLFGADLRSATGLDTAGFGAFCGAATLCSGLLMFWLGEVADRLALRRAVTLAVLLLGFLPLLRRLAAELPDDALAALGKGSPERPLGRFRLLRTPVFLATLAVVLTPAFVITAVFFHQSALAELRGWSAATVGGAFLVFALCRAAGTLVTGRTVDRLGPLPLMRFQKQHAVTSFPTDYRPEAYRPLRAADWPAQAPSVNLAEYPAAFPKQMASIPPRRVTSRPHGTIIAPLLMPAAVLLRPATAFRLRRESGVQPRGPVKAYTRCNPADLPGFFQNWRSKQNAANQTVCKVPKIGSQGRRPFPDKTRPARMAGLSGFRGHPRHGTPATGGPPQAAVAAHGGL